MARNPNASPAESAFVDACMESEVISASWVSETKKCSLCQSQWARAQKLGKETWAEMIEQIEKDGVVITENEARVLLPAVSREELEGKEVKWTGCPPAKMGPEYAPEAPTIKVTQTR
jgi:hypothetical protein